ncbi:transposase, partial [Gottschalkia purinilytica]
MYLTTVNRLRLNQNEFNLVKELCWLSKNLYNSTLYEVRQHYFNTSEFLKYTKAYHILKNTENYKLLPSQVAQQTMKVVERTMKSFFGLLREKKKGNYNKPIKIPRYLNKEGKFVLLYTPAHMRYISNNQIRLTVKKELLEKHNLKELIITIPKHIIGKTIKELRINPLGQFLKVEFIYLNNENNYPKVTKNKNILSIDLGIDNLCTMINNVNNQPIIIDGREIKSINRLFNKNLSKYKSISKKVNDRYSTKKIDRLYYKRNNVFKDKFHKVSNYIINYCIDNNISKVIIGYNQEWKQNINIGKTN